MASHFPQRPDTGNDDPRVVHILQGREWLAPYHKPSLYDLRVEQLKLERDRPTKGEWWFLLAGVNVAMWLVILKFIGWL